MTEEIFKITRKARFDHVCDWCGEKIEKGYKYNHKTLKCDGDLYTWKSHPMCDDVFIDLRDIFLCDDGVTGEEFRDGCHDFCRNYICPYCPHVNTEDYDDIECDKDREFCIGRIHGFMLTHELVFDRGSYVLQERMETKETDEPDFLLFSEPKVKKNKYHISDMDIYFYQDITQDEMEYRFFNALRSAGVTGHRGCPH